MLLTKMYSTEKDIVVLGINKIINNYKGFSIIDYFERVFLEHKNFLIQEFNNNLIFISTKSFQQNHRILGKTIRKYINDLIELEGIDCILCIGGESYIYGMINKKIVKIYHYTNSVYIYRDCEYNNKFYRKEIENNYIEYNSKDLKIISEIKICLINLSSLTKNLFVILNKNNDDKIIIISCHHEDFWKKIKNLTNYIIKKRKYFVCERLRYFITVNIFVKKIN